MDRPQSIAFDITMHTSTNMGFRVETGHSIKQSALACVTAILIASCGQKKVFQEIPPDYSLRYKEVIYAENDGRCPDDWIIKITGGKAKHNIPRQYECEEDFRR